MKEIEIKRILIPYLLSEFSGNCLLGSEFRFDFGARRVDIIALEEHMAYAYEIKGAGDSVSRLPKQIEGYKDYFDYCYIVCESSNLDSVLKVCPKDVGVIFLDNGVVIKKRKSRKFKKQSKIMLSSTLSTDVLRSNVGSIKGSKHELCEFFIEKNKFNDVKILSRIYLIEKLRHPFDTFMREKGDAISYDDISTLNRMPSFKLF